MFINTHQFKEVNMSKKREEEPNPLLEELLKGFAQYKKNKSLDQDHQTSEALQKALQIMENAIDKGANSLHNLCFGETPLSLAARSGFSDIVELMLLKNVDPKKAKSLEIIKLPEVGSERYVATPLHVAAGNKQPEVAEILVKKMGCEFNQNNQFSPLHLAIANKDTKTVTKLVQGGCDPNVPDFLMGKTAYQWAQDYGGEDFSNFNFDVTKE